MSKYDDNFADGKKKSIHLDEYSHNPITANLMFCAIFLVKKLFWLMTKLIYNGMLEFT